MTVNETLLIEMSNKLLNREGEKEPWERERNKNRVKRARYKKEHSFPSRSTTKKERGIQWAFEEELNNSSVV